ncbi:MAG: translation initiation factor 2, partial [Desulfovibrionaceae bacterium]|nr:translation initiation factor 2 [Desulfovibrionaceae bacterium]
CLILFFTPVLIFLWPSFFSNPDFTASDLETFQETFRLRWAKDYGPLEERLLSIPEKGSAFLTLTAAGGLSWLYVLRKGSPQARSLAGMYPAFVLALLLIMLFSWAEGRYASEIGRPPLGHELVRGIRFLVPLSWLMLIAALACVWERLAQAVRVLLVLCFTVGLFLITPDRQNMAVQYVISQSTGLPLPMRAEAQASREAALAYREALEALDQLVPKDQLIYSNTNDMAVRYLLLRPLAHTFKDGYVFYYNKDVDGCRQWLRHTKLHNESPTSYINAWQLSDAPILFTNRKNDEKILNQYGKILWSNDTYMIVRKHT